MKALTVSSPAEGFATGSPPRTTVSNPKTRCLIMSHNRGRAPALMRHPESKCYPIAAPTPAYFSILC
jgi:hypothetical protein